MVRCGGAVDGAQIPSPHRAPILSRLPVYLFLVREPLILMRHSHFPGMQPWAQGRGQGREGTRAQTRSREQSRRGGGLLSRARALYVGYGGLAREGGADWSLVA